MSRFTFTLLSSAGLVTAFPWVANLPGVDNSLLKRAEAPSPNYDYGTCPFNPTHTGAAPFDPKFPYTGANLGAPGTQVGGILVPAKGDTAHQYTAPGPNDIRGPCPGLNAAANHNFLSHDGVTTFTELVDAQQNVYNVGWDLAVALATAGVGFDGDFVTEKVSIGCDATSRTALAGALGAQPGLNSHNRFEADSSLTRNDFFTNGGDNYRFDGTLFEQMRKTANNVFDRTAMANTRLQRYQQSLAQNPNFYFGPKSLLLYGASSFLYTLFPSDATKGGQPDLATISSFFGAVSDGKGGWSKVGERIPDNWYSRTSAYTLLDVSAEILAQYLAHPVLFGGNVGVNNFDALGSFGSIANGSIASTATAKDVGCLLYQVLTEDSPATAGVVDEIPTAVYNWTAGKLYPVFANFGCPFPLNH